MIIYLTLLLTGSLCNLPIDREINLTEWGVYNPIYLTSDGSRHLLVSLIPNKELKAFIFDYDQEQNTVISLFGNGPGELINFAGVLSLIDHNSFIAIDHIAHKYVIYKRQFNGSWVLLAESFFSRLELLFPRDIKVYKDRFFIFYTDFDRRRINDRLLIYSWDMDFRNNEFAGELILNTERKPNAPPFPGRFIIRNVDGIFYILHTHIDKIWKFDPASGKTEFISGIYRKPSDYTINRVKKSNLRMPVEFRSSNLAPFYDWSYTNGSRVLYDYNHEEGRFKLVTKNINESSDMNICEFPRSKRILQYNGEHMVVLDRSDDENWKLVFYKVPD